MWPEVVCPGERPTHMEKKVRPAVLGGSVLQRSARAGLEWYFFVDPLTRCSIHWTWDNLHYCWVAHFPLQFCHFLLLVFCSCCFYGRADFWRSLFRHSIPEVFPPLITYLELRECKSFSVRIHVVSEAQHQGSHTMIICILPSYSRNMPHDKVEGDK